MASAPSDFFLLIPRLFSMVAGLSTPLWFYYELIDRKWSSIPVLWTGHYSSCW